MHSTQSVSDFVTVRGVKLHVRRWGRPDAPTLYMLHGWMDVAASFQFVVDALAGDWQVIAPDARGFGLSDWPVAAQGGGHYWFHEYLVDLEALIDHYTPDGEVNLVGHSMGANVVCLYAGARPQRVRRVVDLEGFGLAPARAEQAPRRLAQWLDELRAPPELKRYASLEDVAARLVKTNPRLEPRRAAFLAAHWSTRDADGWYRLLADPAHKLRGPLLYRLDEVMAIWSKVRAKVLHVEAVDSPTLAFLAGEIPIAEFKARFAAFADWREKRVEDAGHMVHHDQPEQIAALIEAFCA
ncbi:alpha/beta hydrolase [Burkholderia pseudomallei]|uniref:alpha/beta fold hydrolase n=1 Tax=Burkholderia TaxID=32008 RepID=UPI00046B71DD|nr:MULTISPECIES: alpha/beta hydrolase [Burkholderia]AIP48200.1 alpha/beta hydrolase family protein [Burkholderia pseudomallei MSHR5858]ANW49615.1 alpha/beta hydrolase [Burkholderia pseudomallei]ANW55641.1 alpha/beta hydrolase [Burkholderia pseudomallei]APD34857.1 alpha/beta hydrolase [Burkholderia pseudomallei]ARK41710.1 alpha/beta hydrolase [Burkholderia pseudomallei]